MTEMTRFIALLELQRELRFREFSVLGLKNFLPLRQEVDEEIRKIRGDDLKEIKRPDGF